MKKYCSIILFIALSKSNYAQHGYKVIKFFKIASSGGWDYLAIQPNSNNLFVSHSTQVNILDKSTGDSLGVIHNTFGVHGIAFVPSLNKGYTSNGKLNNVFIFDLTTFAVKDSIATGQNPDAIFYDNYTKRIITCNGRSKDVTFIDPLTDKVTATVAVGGRPETAVSNGAGKIFVNLEDKNEIAVIDATTLKVIAHWALASGEAPTGLAIDNDTKRLFAACGDNNLLIILDAEKGTIIDRIKIGSNCDGAAFDAALKNIYTSNGEGTLSIIHEDSKDKFTLTATVPTKKGARTITVDEQTHLIYLSAADLQPAKEGERPKMIPGTFQVLVVGK